MHACDIIFCPMDQRNDNRITEGSIWTFLPIEKNNNNNWTFLKI